MVQFGDGGVGLTFLQRLELIPSLLSEAYLYALFSSSEYELGS